MSATSWRVRELAVLVYRRHVPTGPARCCCGGAGCQARRRAAAVLAALGDDPGRYDDNVGRRSTTAPVLPR
jgi:hypothetical protein